MMLMTHDNRHHQGDCDSARVSRHPSRLHSASETVHKECRALKLVGRRETPTKAQSPDDVDRHMLAS